jgi:hypothetical protein
MLASNDALGYYSSPPVVVAPPMYDVPPPAYFADSYAAQPLSPVYVQPTPIIDYGNSSPVLSGQFQAPPTFMQPTFQDDTRSTVSDTWTLALSEVTVQRSGEPAPLNLLEELMLLKAGDCAKFARGNPTLDRILAAALILELVLERKVGIEGDGLGNPRNLVLQLLDDTPTGSNLINSAITAIKKRGNKPFTIATVMDKVANSQQGGLGQRILWRLVKKNKCQYDPRVFGADKYPVVGGASDVQILRDKVIGVMDRNADQYDIRDLCLAFLYYLPKNAADRVFEGQLAQSTYFTDVYNICRSIALNVQEYKSQRNWI